MTNETLARAREIALAASGVSRTASVATNDVIDLFCLAPLDASHPTARHIAMSMATPLSFATTARVVPGPAGNARAGRVHDAGAVSVSSSRVHATRVGFGASRRTRVAPPRAVPLEAVEPIVAAAVLPAAPALFELSLFGLSAPFADAAKDADGNVPIWFPVASTVAYFWVAGEVRKIRREQERKAMARASKAASEAAQRKVESIPPEAWAKLVVCLVIDGLGDSSFFLPGLGELSDFAYAPLEAFLLNQLFRSNAIASLGFIEEALPFTDVLPTATLAWVLEEFFADSPPGKLLGLDKNPEPEREKK